MTPLTISDTMLRDALMPGADHRAPDGLLADIADAVRAEPQVRAGIHWPWQHDLGVPITATRSGRVALALLVLGLVVTMVTGALIGARVFWRDPPREPTATGIETLTFPANRFERVIEDGAGTLWAYGIGHLARFAPGAPPADEWTIADDLAFASWSYAPAIDGGVWLWSDDGIRRFDGLDFRATIPAPPTASDISAIAETPDGGLWAGTWGGGLWRWDGTAWEMAPTGGPTTIWPLLAVGEDDVWMGSLEYPGPRRLGVWHLDSGVWTSWDGDDGRVFVGEQPLLAEGSDGAIWLASLNGIARYISSAWEMTPDPGLTPYGLAIGDDGGAWVVDAFGTRAARWLDGRWVQAAGAAEDGIGALRSFDSTRAGLFATTELGVYRVTASGWEPAWPVEARGPSFPWSTLVVGSDELWSAEDHTLWHFRDGRWSTVAGAWSEASIRSLARSADGALVVATADGIYRQGDAEGWEEIASADVLDLAVGRDGVVWGTLPHALLEVRREQGSWSTRLVSCPSGGWRIALAADGSVWTGGIDYTGSRGLARYDGRSCTDVDLRDGRVFEVLAIEPLPSGGVAVLEDYHEIAPGQVAGDATERYALLRTDGAGWTQLRPTVDRVLGLAIGPQGDIWLAGDGLHRYRDGVWQVVVGDIDVYDPTIGPDGSVYFEGPSGLQRIRPADLPE